MFCPPSDGVLIDLWLRFKKFIFSSWCINVDERAILIGRFVHNDPRRVHVSCSENEGIRMRH